MFFLFIYVIFGHFYLLNDIFFTSYPQDFVAYNLFITLKYLFALHDIHFLFFIEVIVDLQK